MIMKPTSDASKHTCSQAQWLEVLLLSVGTCVNHNFTVFHDEMIQTND